MYSFTPYNSLWLITCLLCHLRAGLYGGDYCICLGFITALWTGNLDISLLCETHIAWWVVDVWFGTPVVSVLCKALLLLWIISCLYRWELQMHQYYGKHMWQDELWICNRELCTLIMCLWIETYDVPVLCRVLLIWWVILLWLGIQTYLCFVKQSCHCDLTVYE